jgi:hypothetical protein
MMRRSRCFRKPDFRRILALIAVFSRKVPNSCTKGALIGARLCLIGRDEVVRRRTTPGFRLARQTENGIDRSLKGSHACALDVVGVNRSWGSAGLLAELLFQVSQPDSCALRTYS